MSYFRVTSGIYVTHEANHIFYCREEEMSKEIPLPLFYLKAINLMLMFACGSGHFGALG